MALGDFLVAYLRKTGVSHVFGIPGDLALKLFFALGRKHGLEIITLSHEPGVGFAADDYRSEIPRLFGASAKRADPPPAEWKPNRPSA